MKANPAAVASARARGGAGYPYGESSLCCVVTSATSESENALGGAFFRGSPGVLPLNVTDGSNCAEKHFSGALIIYAVCCVLLSKVPCSEYSECIHFRRECYKGDRANSS